MNKPYNPIDYTLSVTPSKNESLQSRSIEFLTDKNATSTQRNIKAAIEKKQQLLEKIAEAEKNLSEFKRRNFFRGFLPNEQYTKKLNDLQKQIELAGERFRCYRLGLKVNIEGTLWSQYQLLRMAFSLLHSPGSVWDATVDQGGGEMTGEHGKYMVSNYKKTAVTFCEAELDLIEYEYPAMFLENANGANLYFYPNFVLLVDGQKIAVINIDDINVSGEPFIFMEKQPPASAQIVDYMWLRAKNDGSRDMRYKDNARIPIIQSYRINIKTSAGVNECYLVMNHDYGKRFCEQLKSYIEAWKASRGGKPQANAPSPIKPFVCRDQPKEHFLVPVPEKTEQGCSCGCLLAVLAIIIGIIIYFWR